MCKWNKWGDTRIDPCMRKFIKNLNDSGIRTLACCCGHGVYPMTIVADLVIKPFTAPRPVEMFSNVEIPRKKKFYRRDKQGYYYIPEVVGK